MDKLLIDVAFDEFWSNSGLFINGPVQYTQTDFRLAFGAGYAAKERHLEIANRGY